MLNWYAIYTKPQSEESVSHMLRNAGLEVLSPKTRIKKFSRGKYEYVIEPLFRSYIFANFDSNTHHHMIRYTRGVKYIVGKNHPIVVPQEIITAMQEQMEDEIITPKQENLSRGDRVVVSEGPFASFYGIFQHPVPGRDRVVILLEALNSRLEVEDVSVRKA
jgi:transcription elongation factor/antiterminator RfaH